MKSRSGPGKRFWRTGTGKLMRKRAGKRHILTKMSRKQKRQLRREDYVTAADRSRIAKQMPYS